MIILTIIVVPNERYYIIAVPAIYIMSSIFIIRLFNIKCSIKIKTLIYLVIVLFIIVNGIDLERNYFNSYTKVINEQSYRCANQRCNCTDDILIPIITDNVAGGTLVFIRTGDFNPESVTKKY